LLKVEVIMFRRTHSPARSVLLSTLSTLLLLASGCGASVPSQTVIDTIDYRPSIAAQANDGALQLQVDKARAQRGDMVALSLVNASSLDYGNESSCVTPTTIWFRAESGATYFANSGSLSACATSTSAIASGASAEIAIVDTAMVWVDRSQGETLDRLPRSLPNGRYTVHALTTRGELTTTIQIGL